MEILSDIPLAGYTTFKIGGRAKAFVYAQTEEDVIEGLNHANREELATFVFGGGSNSLVNDTGFDGLAIRVETIGIDIEEDNEDYVILKVASGEVWDDVVRFAVEQSWYGIENLSHIPGFTGAFAIQNVGAYGQEASQVVEKVDAYDTVNKKIVTFTNSECEFGYRSSIFNTTQKDKYVIFQTYIKLQKRGQANLSYGDLKKYFSEEDPSLEQVRQAVITIRNTKFPFPDQPTTGNAGSFFRGPLLSVTEFNTLLDKIKNIFGQGAHEKLLSMQDRLQVPQGFKTPTAFLIEQCGLKGYQLANVKVNEAQPTVVVNFTGQATAAEVLLLFQHVAKTVYNRTSVKLHIEPELIGFSQEQKKKLLDFEAK